MQASPLRGGGRLPSGFFLEKTKLWLGADAGLDEDHDLTNGQNKPFALAQNLRPTARRNKPLAWASSHLTSTMINTGPLPTALGSHTEKLKTSALPRPRNDTHDNTDTFAEQSTSQDEPTRRANHVDTFATHSQADLYSLSRRVVCENSHSPAKSSPQEIHQWWRRNSVVDKKKTEIIQDTPPTVRDVHNCLSNDTESSAENFAEESSVGAQGVSIHNKVPTKAFLFNSREEERLCIAAGTAQAKEANPKPGHLASKSGEGLPITTFAESENMHMGLSAPDQDGKDESEARKDAILSMEASLAVKEATLRQREAAIEKKANSLCERMSSLDAQSKAMKDQLDAVDARAKNLDARESELGRIYSQHVGSQALKEIQDALEERTQELNARESRLDTREAKLVVREGNYAAREATMREAAKSNSKLDSSLKRREDAVKQREEVIESRELKIRSESEKHKIGHTVEKKIDTLFPHGTRHAPLTEAEDPYTDIYDADSRVTEAIMEAAEAKAKTAEAEANYAESELRVSEAEASLAEADAKIAEMESELAELDGALLREAVGLGTLRIELAATDGPTYCARSDMVESLECGASTPMPWSPTYLGLHCSTGRTPSRERDRAEMTIVKTELELEQALLMLADAEKRADDAELSLAEYRESSTASFVKERRRSRYRRGDQVTARA